MSQLWQSIVQWVTDIKAWTAPGPLAQMAIILAAFWIVMQLLPNSWAGGRLFERRWAWVTSSLAAVVLFVFLVVPHITSDLLVGFVVVAVLVGFAIFAKARWH